MDCKIIGKVIKGDGYGKKIGFPTVNLEKDESSRAEALPPYGVPDGVYAGVGVLDGKEYRAGIIMGPHDKIEAHLIGYNGDAYGKQVTLKIKKILRKYKKFNSEEELIAQIKEDLKICSQV